MSVQSVLDVIVCGSFFYNTDFVIFKKKKISGQCSCVTPSVQPQHNWGMLFSLNLAPSGYGFETMLTEILSPKKCQTKNYCCHQAANTAKNKITSWYIHGCAMTTNITHDICCFLTRKIFIFPNWIKFSHILNIQKKLSSKKI